jgi:hypothetical protein
MEDRGGNQANDLVVSHQIFSFAFFCAMKTTMEDFVRKRVVLEIFLRA